MRIDVDARPWFDIGDDESLSYEQKLLEYRRLADDHFQAEEYAAFCASALPHLDELAHEWFTGDEFDRLLVDTVRTTFPAHEHEQFAAHYRGLIAAWSRDAAVT
jgi:hypothetical protein